MSRKIVALFFAIIIFPAVGQSKDVATSDGTDWKSWSDSSKAPCISGFIMGANLGARYLAGDEATLKKAGESNKSPDLRYRLEMAIKHKKSIAIYGITVGQLMEGIDAFYSDFSNTRIRIIDAIYIAKLQISGAAPEHIAAQMRYLRMHPINQDSWDKSWDRITTTKLANYNNKIDYKITRKDLDEGKVSEEDFLVTGTFLTSTLEEIDLFSYGTY